MLICFQVPFDFLIEWLNGKLVRFSPMPTLPPQRYVSKESSKCHCVFCMGRWWFRQLPLTSPETGPKVLFATAEGCQRKRQHTFALFSRLCPSLWYLFTMRGRRRGHYEQSADLFDIPQPFFFIAIVCWVRKKRSKTFLQNAFNEGSY